MNWFKENKFLTGLIIFVVIGGGVLGYLLSSAMAKTAEATTNFEAASSELQRLETLPVYPNSKNLKKVEEQRAQHQQRIDELQGRLAEMTLPSETLSPELFQDRLRETVNAFLKKAATERLEIKEPGRYMGYDRYRVTPPRPEAAALLGRQLKAVNFVLDQLIQNHVLELRDIKRGELPEESGATAPVAATPRPAPGQPPGAKKAPVREQFTRTTLELTYFCDQSSFQGVLNALTSAKSQFFIVRNLDVKNEKQTAPPRVTAPQAATADPTAPPAPNDGTTPPPAPNAGAATGRAFEFVVGQERIEVTMLVEIVNFSPAPAADPKGGKPTPNR